MVGWSAASVFFAFEGNGPLQSDEFRHRSQSKQSSGLLSEGNHTCVAHHYRDMDPVGSNHRCLTDGTPHNWDRRIGRHHGLLTVSL